MSDPLAWRLGARIPAHDYRVFSTAFVDGEHPRTGAHKQFSLIDAVDWVNVIALTPERRVVLIRQFRVGANSICLEIPGGMVDAGESPEVAAARELAEETGYTSSRWQRLGDVSPNPAIMTNRLHSFLALDAVQTQAQHLEGSEVIDVELATLADCHAAIRDGRIDHALVIVAFAHLAFRQLHASASNEP
ncbi:MAG TPA: NUDIX hydrolase [Kofleriaceae bacterium]|jgi:8-oxo-dGTP pyrophosphatase MutT (NUDIX family)